MKKFALLALLPLALACDNLERNPTERPVVTPNRAYFPTQVKELGFDAESISSGENHNCAVTRTGKAFCWGTNQKGELGNAATAISDKQAIPVEAKHTSFKVVRRIAAGNNFTCALVDTEAVDRQVFCWGSNSRSQLGQNDGASIAYSPVPLPVLGENTPTLEGVASGLLAQHGRACALKNGNLLCWGDVPVETKITTPGTGNEPPKFSFEPRLEIHARPFNVNPHADNPAEGSWNSKVASISTFLENTCVLLDDGTLKCLGRTFKPAIQAQALAAGMTEACIVDKDFDREVYCWDHDGDTVSKVKGLPTDSPFVKLASGYRHVCALRQAGDVWCWGSNLRGQLGIGREDQKEQPPSSVQYLGDVVDLSAGRNHTCAVRRNGTAWCWGDNTNGQVGSSAP